MSQEQNKDMSQYFYRASAADFMKIPGSPVAYWSSPRFLDIFKTNETLNAYGVNTATGLQTGDNSKFIRYWFEVYKTKKREKWRLLNDGGDARKWYGNLISCIDWENDGEKIKSHKSSVIRNVRYFYQEGATWSRISSEFFAIRYLPEGLIFDQAGDSLFTDTKEDLLLLIGFLNSPIGFAVMKVLCPTLNATAGSLELFPYPARAKSHTNNLSINVSSLISCAQRDWDSYETSWDFTTLPLLHSDYGHKLQDSYEHLRLQSQENIVEMQRLEEENNRLFIEAYGLQDELTPEVPLEEITLTCNPHYRYGGNRSEEELETLLQCDTIRELVSYAIGCMMGRYSRDKPGLILASQGETLQDYLRQIPNPSFAPDADAILPLTDQEWFTDDATNRLREFIRVVWGEETLQENLDFVAESLCLHAIKAKRGESALDTIRRYLSTQFFKDHLRTYKKRPIYWLFSSGKHKAFECLVYLHRYNEGTLARMRTEYVIPLSARLNSYAEKLEQAKDAASSTAETKRLEKELTTLHNQQAELAEFDEKLRHYADQRISLNLDDGVKVNYGKFGDLLAEVKSVAGSSE